jgi:hypothetical protein
VKSELDAMIKQGVISPVTEPTTWCSGMVVVPKKNGNIRLCVDLTSLNKAVQREIHPMKSVDENLSKLKDSCFFSKLDANSGFWQLPLDEESQKLTTFITPFGRFFFNRLPFGISSAPEIYQRTMSNILHGLENEGVICHMDDVLIHGRTKEEHHQRVRKVLQRLQEAGITLNSKCEFTKERIKFLGHVVSAKGIEADPGKVNAIKQFPTPVNIKDLQRFNGMINQVAKFLPGLAEITQPIRQLLRKDTTWVWDKPQETAFDKIKQMLTTTEVLGHYDPSRPTIVAADASSYGLGAVLMQEFEDGSRRPICYASRSLNEAESRYATIEKEALAATWACTKFSDFITGLNFRLETDHRPLVPLLSTTDLTKMPPRILRFRLLMMRFNPTVVYVRGKNQALADALSRAPVDKPTSEDNNFVEEIEKCASNTLSVIPASQTRLQTIREAQHADAEITQVIRYCKETFP